MFNLTRDFPQFSTPLRPKVDLPDLCWRFLNISVRTGVCSAFYHFLLLTVILVISVLFVPDSCSFSPFSCSLDLIFVMKEPFPHTHTRVFFPSFL